MLGAIIRFWLRSAHICSFPFPAAKKSSLSSPSAAVIPTTTPTTMTLLFGFECPNELYGAICGIFVFAVLQLAWRTTFVRNQRSITPGTIILVERTHTANSWRSRVRLFESRSNSTDTEDIELEEATALADNQSAATAAATAGDNATNEHERHIINAMDAAAPVASNNTSAAAPTTTAPSHDGGDLMGRSPIVVHIGGRDAGESNVRSDGDAAASNSSGAEEADAIDVVDAQNCTNENSENSRDENNGDVVSATTTTPEHRLTETTTAEASATHANNANETAFTVKLKYLNDDIKIASGKPSERIGDFTNRHFAAELADNKSIRLIFNGQVLRPETKTLRACGMFADCVVHCLVRNTPPTPPPVAHESPAHAEAQHIPTTAWRFVIGGVRLDGAALPNATSADDAAAAPIAAAAAAASSAQQLQQQRRAGAGGRGAELAAAGYSQQMRQWRIDFGPGRQVTFITGFVLVTVALAWYVRIEHSHLFNTFSTLGLTLLSAMLVFTWYLLGRLEEQMERNRTVNNADNGDATAAAAAGVDVHNAQQQQQQQQQAQATGWGI